MFKQRKARGSLKQKKAESGSDNESESEGVSEGVRESGSGNKEVSKSKSKIKSKSVKKKPGPSMSFMGEDNDLMDEEGGGDVAVFKVKKSKLSKTIKRKLHQNHEVEEPLVSGGGGGGGEPVSAYGSSSSSVSPSDYLSSLRKEQNYAAPQMQSQTLGGLEGMELTGEEAESMEELTETLERRQQAGSSTESDDLPDFIPLKKEQRLAEEQVDLQSKTHTHLEKEVQLEAQDEVDDECEEDDWEEQLAKRAGVHVAPGPTSTSSSSATTSQSQHANTPSVSKEDTEKILHMLSYQTVQRTLRSQITALTDRTDMADSRLRSLDSSLENHRQEAKTLRQTSEKKNSQMEFLRQFRLYASDMCGMLREKEILIGELQSAVLEHLKAQATHRFDYWKKRQDMILDCMRQAGEVITLGGYLPANYQGDSEVGLMSFPTLEEECRETFGAEQDLQATMHTFHTAADTLMQDVRPDLASLSSVLKLFQDFRREHFDKYKDAYISLSLSQILKHYILLDVVPMYLLDSNNSDKFEISSRPWFSALFNFSTEDTAAFKENSDPKNRKIFPEQPKEKSQYIDDSDNDDTLLPRVVAQVVLPWFIDVVEVSLNPLSVTQMSTCRHILKQFQLFDLSEHQVAPLCLAVLKCAVKWIGSICIPVIKMSRPGELRIEKPLVFGQDSLNYSGSTQFFVRQQLDRLSLIMENLFMFYGVIAPFALARVAWTALTSQGQGAMIKLLAGGIQSPNVLTDDEVSNFVSVARVCKSVRNFLPLPSVSSKVKDMYKKLNIPEMCCVQLSPLVLTLNGSVSDGNPRSNSSAAEIRYHRAALLKFLRQLPT